MTRQMEYTKCIAVLAKILRMGKLSEKEYTKAKKCLVDQYLMCECAYCGHKLTRRTRHSSSIYEKPVWQCMNAAKNGIANCPNCKAVDEAILEGAFIEVKSRIISNLPEFKAN